jgi:hypothetical protein
MIHLKEVISPGSYWYVDEQTQQPRRLDVTREMVHYLHEQGREMLKAGLSIPVPIEHQREAAPLTSQERAAQQLRNNAGWVDDYVLRPGDRLFARVNIEDEEINRKLPSTIKWTSPWLNSFTDGNGKEWKGVITHLALTSRPRITRQEPFGKEAAALSLAQPVKPEGVPTGIFISRAGRLDRSLGSPGFRPHYAAAFSVLSGIQLAEDYDLPEDKKPPPKDKKDTPPPPPKGKEPPVPPEQNMQEEEMGMVEVLCEMAAALWGIELPEGTTEDNLLQRLLRAMLDHLKGESGMDSMPEEDEMAELEKKRETPPPAQKPLPVVEEQPPVFMSLEQVNALPEGDLKKMARAMLSMQAQTESLRKNVFDQALAARNTRIDSLAKKTGKAGYRDKLLAQATSIQLSLDAAGKVVDPFSAMLDLLEEGIKDLPALLKDQAGIVEMAQPEEAGAAISEERRKQIVEELTRNAGLPAA